MMFPWAKNKTYNHHIQTANNATSLLYVTLTAKTNNNLLYVTLTANTFSFQLIAAPNRLKFWFQLGSIVDFCTIPPCVLAIFLERNWLGEFETNLMTSKSDNFWKSYNFFHGKFQSHVLLPHS